MTASANAPLPAAARTLSGWGALRQQILNLMERASARAAERRALGALARRELDDCGLTPADQGADLPDLYAQDFRVARWEQRRAA